MGFLSNLFDSTNKFNAEGATLQNTDFNSALNNAVSAGGQSGNADQTRGMQNQFAQALMQQMQGNGPSVAEQQLAGTLNQNNATSAGQIGSARGTNAGLQTRQIAMANASNNQNAASSGAQMRAQEQLNAQGQMGNTLGNQRSQDLSQQQNANSYLGTLGGLQNTQNANQIQNKLGAAQINAGVAGQNAQTNQKNAGGFMSGGASYLGLAHGGVVPHYADGGQVAQLPNFLAAVRSLMGTDEPAAQKKPPKEDGLLSGDTDGGNLVGTSYGGDGAAIDSAAGGAGAGAADAGGGIAALGGDAGAGGLAGMLGGGAAAAEGGSLIGELAPLIALAAHGGKIPGRAPVKGDSSENDTVPAVLSPGEVVLPRTVTNAKDAGNKAKEFVDSIQRKQENDGKGYGSILEAHRKLKEATAHLEKFYSGGRA